MTATLRVSIVCNGPACRAVYLADTRVVGEARAAATAEGWTCAVIMRRPSGPAAVRDFCPDCAQFVEPDRVVT
jgi:hypothetical protein